MLYIIIGLSVIGTCVNTIIINLILQARAAARKLQGIEKVVRHT